MREKAGVAVVDEAGRTGAVHPTEALGPLWWRVVDDA